MTQDLTPTPTATPFPTDLPTLARDVLAPFFVGVGVALLILLVSLLLARFARTATLHALARTKADQATALLIGRVVFVAVLTIGALTALGAMGIPWTTVIALASVLGLAASLALQDVLKNFVAGIYLLVERPFRLGEEIKVKEFVGRVETVDVRTTVLRTAEGDSVMVPNAILFAEIILNRGFRRPPGSPAEPPAKGDEPSPV
ncbi:MAG TPA: mechanosensitive ion channel domain-containing protein [Chloroflexota bacterium]|nr:mechanosensitive ion channel domain-containing protein [Chloroflexota bacterium]